MTLMYPLILIDWAWGLVNAIVTAPSISKSLNRIYRALIKGEHLFWMGTSTSCLLVNPKLITNYN